MTGELMISCTCILLGNPSQYPLRVSLYWLPPTHTTLRGPGHHQGRFPHTLNNGRPHTQMLMQICTHTHTHTHRHRGMYTNKHIHTLTLTHTHTHTPVCNLTSHTDSLDRPQLCLPNIT